MWHADASFPYLNTVTCAGHGLFPLPAWHDLVIVPREGAVVGTADEPRNAVRIRPGRADHLVRQGIRSSVYSDAASPADIAVTLASLIGITLPAPDGHVLGAVRPTSSSGR
jgi:hypothetical protein